MRLFSYAVLGMMAAVEFQPLTVRAGTASPPVKSTQPLAPSGASGAEPWDDLQVISPKDLAARLARGDGAKLTIVQVGFSFQYRQKHITGALFAGPAIRPEGLSMLKTLVKDLPRDREVIIYCGCCPWEDCPNIKPASQLLRQLGFSRARVLQLPANFISDWADKGFPVEGGAPPAPMAGLGK